MTYRSQITSGISGGLRDGALLCWPCNNVADPHQDERNGAPDTCCGKAEKDVLCGTVADTHDDGKRDGRQGAAEGEMVSSVAAVVGVVADDQHKDDTDHVDGDGHVLDSGAGIAERANEGGDKVGDCQGAGAHGVEEDEDLGVSHERV